MSAHAHALCSVATIIATLVVLARAGEPKNPCIVFPTGGPHQPPEPPKNYTTKYQFFDKVVLDHLAEIHVKHMCSEAALAQVYEQLRICYAGPLRWCKEWFQDQGRSGLAPLAPLDPLCFPDLRYTDTQYCGHKHTTTHDILTLHS